MTRDEQRLAWRAYAAALLAGDDVDLQAVVKAADWLVQEERKRFGHPDHSGDADKKVEPKPWVSLTVIERIKLRGWFNRHESATLDDLLIHHDELLREKNGGTR